MPKFKVLSDRLTFAGKGDTFDSDDHPELNVRALVKARLVEAAPDKPKKTTRTQKTTKKADD